MPSLPLPFTLSLLSFVSLDRRPAGVKHMKTNEDQQSHQESFLSCWPSEREKYIRIKSSYQMKNLIYTLFSFFLRFGFQSERRWTNEITPVFFCHVDSINSLTIHQIPNAPPEATIRCASRKHVCYFDRTKGKGFEWKQTEKKGCSTWNFVPVTFACNSFSPSRTESTQIFF